MSIRTPQEISASVIAAWAERRLPRSEGERADIARHYAAHLPEAGTGRFVSDEDLNAMKAAFILRFDEDLPRTETLMAVASIGYRMALRDLLNAHQPDSGRE